MCLNANREPNPTPHRATEANSIRDLGRGRERERSMPDANDACGRLFFVYKLSRKNRHTRYMRGKHASRPLEGLYRVGASPRRTPRASRSCASTTDFGTAAQGLSHTAAPPQSTISLSHTDHKCFLGAHAPKSSVQHGSPRQQPSAQMLPAFVTATSPDVLRPTSSAKLEREEAPWPVDAKFFPLQLSRWLLPLGMLFE